MAKTFIKVSKVRATEEFRIPIKTIIFFLMLHQVVLGSSEDIDKSG